jgi:toxin ParE1/3/4
MRLRYRARARADIDEIRRYLQRRSPSGARNVLRSIHAALEFIAGNPEASEATDDLEVRVKVIVDYPYKIFYRIHANSIEILHIRHSARRSWIGER